MEPNIQEIKKLKSNQKIVLTPEQEKQILELWNKDLNKPPGLRELTKAVFGGALDGRSFEGSAIKSFLVRCNLKPITTTEYIPKGDNIVLTEEQIQYLANNAGTMNSLEMTKVLFGNNALVNTSAETRAVNNFVKTLDTRVVYNSASNEDIPEGKYIPPNTIDAVLKRVNKYVNFILKKDKLNGQQKKGLEMLVNYLHTHRFIRQMNEFESEEDRTTCEDDFIRCTYDKPDLTQEEVNQYIELANQTVQGIKTSRRKNVLEDRFAERTGEQDSKVRMDLVEAIGKAGTEYDQCIKRQNTLLADLKEKRSTRLSKQIKENASINNLVQDWRNEEYRLKMLKLGELEQQTLAKEYDKMMTMEDVKCRLMGINREDIIPS